MTTDFPAPRPAVPALPEGGPRTLGSADESRLALALSVRVLFDKAMKVMPVDPDAAPGALITAALGLHQSTKHIVETSVVAEHARGTTWEQIGAAAGITKQTAHERWSQDVRSWAATGSTALVDTSEKRSLDLAAELDAVYARLRPERPAAVSSGLDAVRHPGSAEVGAPQRQHATFLHTRIVALREQGADRHRVFEKRWEAGVRGAQLAAVLRETAALDDRQAALYDELTELEPELAAEHRAAAETRRTAAAQSREFANQQEASFESGPDTAGETR